MIKNHCGFRVNGECAYYPCSDGSPCGKCRILNNPNGCTHTKNIRDMLLHDGEIYEKYGQLYSSIYMKLWIDDYLTEIRLEKMGGSFVGYEWLFNALDIDPQKRWNPSQDTIKLINERIMDLVSMRKTSTKYESTLHDGLWYDIDPVIHGIKMYLEAQSCN